MIDDTRLANLERLSDAGSAAPWQASVEGRDHMSGDTFIQIGSGEGRGEDMYVSRDSHPASVADLDLIAAARNALPELIAEVRRLRLDLTELTRRTG
jgi:hypothetical protein